MPQADTAKDQADAKNAATNLADVLAHPGFKAIMEEIGQAPPDQRAQVARRLASSAELKRRGIPLPGGPGGKLKIRFFDPATNADLATTEEQLPP